MTNHPSTAYHFKVEWGGTNIGFSEVSGLVIENEIIEYRDGSMPHHTLKMPGLRKYSNIVLKRGMVPGDKELYQWMNTVQQNAAERRDVTISLLNNNHEPIRVWKIKNAWPCKIQVSDLKADANDTAMETIELAHEGLEIIE